MKLIVSIYSIKCQTKIALVIDLFYKFSSSPTNWELKFQSFSVDSLSAGFLKTGSSILELKL